MLRKEDRPLFAALLAVAFAFIICWTIPSPYNEPRKGGEKCTTHECREDASAEAVAEYTEILAVFTALLFFVSMIQGYFVYQADTTARISADAAKDAAQAALNANEIAKIRERPWVKITDFDILFPIVDDGALLTITPSFKFKNVGSTPAANVRAMIHVFPVFSGNVGLPTIIKSVCEAGKSDWPRSDDGFQPGDNVFLFPNDDSSQHWSHPVFISQLERDNAEGGKEAASSLYVIAYVAYGFTFDQSRHCTALAYSVSRKDGQPIFPTQKNIHLWEENMKESGYGDGIQKSNLKWFELGSMGVGRYAD